MYWPPLVYWAGSLGLEYFPSFANISSAKMLTNHLLIQILVFTSNVGKDIQRRPHRFKAVGNRLVLLQGHFQSCFQFGKMVGWLKIRLGSFNFVLLFERSCQLISLIGVRRLFSIEASTSESVRRRPLFKASTMFFQTTWPKTDIFHGIATF
jgi:hypothetical protein